MALRPQRTPPVHARARLACRVRRYATVRPVTLVGKPPGPPNNPTNLAAPAALDSLVLTRLRSTTQPGLPTLLHQYDRLEGHMLDQPLPYESRPRADRKVNFDRMDVFSESGVVMVAHAIRHQDRHQVTLCSGFALNVPARADANGKGKAPESGSENGSTVIVTCAHTLEEIRNSSLLAFLPPQPEGPEGSGAINVHDVSADVTRSGSFVLSGPPNRHTPIFHPVTSVLSSLHRADLLLLSIANGTQQISGNVAPSTSTDVGAGTHGPKMPTLPVSPYPVQSGTPIRAHFVVNKEPDEAGWHPWVGGTWSKWVKGTVLGYRDFAGREAKPGTYDALSHLLFRPLPTAGSSGGPIVDEESGAVVGVMVGTRMDSSIDGVRGWGRPAETIFEMFSLPGLNLRKK